MIEAVSNKCETKQRSRSMKTNAEVWMRLSKVANGGGGQAYTRGVAATLKKRAYGNDYTLGRESDVIGLLERADVKPTEKDLFEFRKSILRSYPSAKQLKLHYDRYDSSKGVDILHRRDLAKALQALSAIRAASEDAQIYTDKDEVPFFDLQFLAKTPEHREWLKALREAQLKEGDFLSGKQSKNPDDDKEIRKNEESSLK